MNSTIQLIEKTSDLYKKRLVRAIRDSFQHGVYHHRDGESGFRIADVRFSKGQLQIRTSVFAGPWRVISDDEIDGFSDGYGRHVVASRRP